jgi:hypothetical protein
LQKSSDWHKSTLAKSLAAYCQTIYWEKYLVNFASENNGGIAYYFFGYFFLRQQKQGLAALQAMKNAHRKMLKLIYSKY